MTALPNPRESRSRRMAEQSTIPAALAILDRAGIAYERQDEQTYRVADRFVFFPVTGFWRTEDRRHQGHGARELVQAANKPQTRSQHRGA